MSDGYQHFKAFLAELKSKVAKQDGVFVPSQENPLLKQKGVILVSQKDVRRLDLARAELSIAHQKIASAAAALNGFEALSLDQALTVQGVIDDYSKTIHQIVANAYARRSEMRAAA